jgi:hypothetical protein
MPHGGGVDYQEGPARISQGKQRRIWKVRAALLKSQVMGKRRVSVRIVVNV